MLAAKGEKSTEIYHINFISCTIASEVSGIILMCLLHNGRFLERVAKLERQQKVSLGRLMENLGNLSTDIVIKHPVR